jgi:hypothetical protein
MLTRFRSYVSYERLQPTDTDHHPEERVVTGEIGARDRGPGPRTGMPMAP